MKILITGASGYVGSRIYKDLKAKGYNVTGTYNNTRLFETLVRVDLADEAEIRELLQKEKPDIIIHSAACVGKAICEEDPKGAQRINVEATRHIAEWAERANAKVIFISSFVAYNPSNVYGKNKADADKIVKKLSNYIILRPSLIIGLSPNRKSKNFFNSLLENVANREATEYDISWAFHITYLGHLSEVIEKIIGNSDINGMVIPVVAKGIVLRFKIAKDLLTGFGIEVRETDKKTIVKLPKLDFRIYKKLGLPFYTYDDVITKVQEEIAEDTKE